MSDNKEGTRASRSQEQLLARLYKQLHGKLDTYAICKETCMLLLEAFRTSTIYIALHFPEKQCFEFAYYISDNTEKKLPDQPENSGLTGLVYASKEPLIIQENAHGFFAWNHAIIINSKREPRSWIGIPIMKGEKFLGVISLQNYETDNYFSAEDIAAISSISAAIADAIEVARDYAFMKRQSADSAMLINAFNALESALDTQKLFELLADKADSLVPGTTAIVYGYDAVIRRYVLIAQVQNLMGIPSALETDIFGPNLLSENNAQIINAPGDSLLRSSLAGIFRDSKVLHIPIYSNRERIGLVFIVRPAGVYDFTRWELDICVALVRQTAALYNNARMYEEARQARAEAEEANKIKSQFLATMSHELRTPLNSIINFAFLLLQEVEGPISAEQRELLSRIELSGKHLLEVINDILDLAKIESGKMELFLEETDTNLILKEIHGIVESLLHGKPIELKLDMQERLPAVIADKLRLRQILLNILSNAIKFTEKGSIVISVKPDDPWLRFSVADTGIGMSESEIGRAFNEFVQLDTGYARKTGGTGLGLPIAKRFVELHGGTITVESGKDRGTTVSFTIPLLGRQGGTSG